MKTFIVSGIAGGIGQLLAHHFDQNGDSVIGLYRNTVPIYKPSGGNYCVDVTNWNDVSRFIDKKKLELGEIVLLACAASNYTALAHNANHNEWEKIIKINLVGAYNVAAACLPIMRQQSYGRIIFFSSVVAQIPTPGASAYSASKAGLWGLAKSLAAENALMGITANCLNLGYMQMGMIKNVPEKYQKKVLEKIPSNNFGDEKSIVSSVEFLIDASYVNGTAIDINGALR